MIEEKLERIANSLEKISDALAGGAVQMPIPFPTKPEVEGKAKPTAKPVKETTKEPLAVESSPKELSRAELLAECERLGVEVDKKKSTSAIQKILDSAKCENTAKEPEVVVEAEVVEAKEDIVQKADEKAASKKDYELDEVRKVVLDFAKTNGADAVIEIVRKASEGAKKKLVELTQKELNTVVKLVKGE